jgi:hypothetical protein
MEAKMCNDCQEWAALPFEMTAGKCTRCIERYSDVETARCNAQWQDWHRDVRALTVLS